MKLLTALPEFLECADQNVSDLDCAGFMSLNGTLTGTNGCEDELDLANCRTSILTTSSEDNPRNFVNSVKKLGSSR
jgi:hypothetical protein